MFRHGRSRGLSEEQRNLSVPCPVMDVWILNAVCSSSSLQHSYRLVCVTMFRSSFYPGISNPTPFHTCVLAPTSVAPYYVQLVSIETDPTRLIDVKCSDYSFTMRGNATLIASSYM
jgi:hypothetical protein